MEFSSIDEDDSKHKHTRIPRDNTVTMSSSASTMVHPKVVLPGDDVTRTVMETKHKMKPKLGTGLSMKSCVDDDSDKKIVATMAGRLEHRRSNNTWFVLHNAKRYIPAIEDRVLGVVEDRAGSDGGADVYRVNIGGPHPAMLSSMAFEGATKRNRPQFDTGTLIYARLISDGSIMDPTLSCQNGPLDVGVPRKDWMTNEGAYGELRGGTVRKISLGLARELLHPNNVVLTELEKRKLKFEVCVGVNGWIWVHSERPEYTILIVNAIANSEVMTVEQVRAMVKALVDTVQKQIQDEGDDE